VAAEPPARRDKSHRRGGRPFRIAAWVVTLAGIVFIVAVIFWSGFVLGISEGGEGGHHHGDGGRDSSQESDGSENGPGSGDSEKHNGMAPYGVVIEQTAPSAAFAG
jgi:hypothetical protein